MGLFVLLFSFFIYLHTAAPNITFHDSGAMLLAGVYLGVPHSPGYPLYCLLIKIATIFIPIGNIAYRGNILCGIFASVAILLFYLTLYKLNKDRIWCCLVSLSLAWTRSIWTQATITEKYTLHLMILIALILIFLLYCLHNYKKKYLFLFFFVLGISFTHHLQTLFILPSALLLFLFTLLKKRNNLSKIIIVLFSLPLLLYIYIPIRALKYTVANWGEPTTLERFINHILGRAYPRFAPVETTDDLFTRLSDHLYSSIIEQYGVCLSIVGILGFIYVLMKLIRKNNLLIFIFLLLILFSTHFYCINIMIYNIEDYYIPANVIFSILISLSILFIKSKAAKFIAYGGMILFILLQLLNNYKVCNKNKYYFTYDFAKNMTLSCSKDEAILFTNGDEQIFPLWYTRWIENYKIDIIPIDLVMLGYDWYAEKVRKEEGINFDIIKTHVIGTVLSAARDRFNSIVKKKIKEIPIYALPVDDIVIKTEEDAARLLPVSLFWRVIDKVPTKKEVYLYLEEYKNKKLIDRYMEYYNKVYKDDRRMRYIIENLYIPYYRNRGRLYKELGFTEAAEEEFKKVHWLLH